MENNNYYLPIYLDIKKPRNIILNSWIKDFESLPLFTVHSIKRWNERSNNSEEIDDLCKVLTECISKNYFFAEVYRRNGKIVHATVDGFFLGKYQQEKETVIMKTFVSLSLLKNTQLEVYYKLKPIFDKLEEIRLMELGPFRDFCLKNTIKNFDYMALEMHMIYNQYFEEKEEA